MPATDQSPAAQSYKGGCHCGALRWRFDSTKSLETLSPRACDCDFCTRHRAAWVSDALGHLQLHARSDLLQRYRQGSNQAEFLLCRECGVLVAVIARREDGRLIGAANRNAFDARDGLVGETPVSPRLLAADVKLARWSELWMPVVLDEPDALTQTVDR